VTFGGEDPAGLTPLVCRALVEKASVAPRYITAVRGPAAPGFHLPAGITVLHSPAELREILCKFDLVITSFGLTAYEAVASGASVLLVNPSRYHAKLSRAEGFPRAGVCAVRTGRLRKVVADPAGYARKMEHLRVKLAGTRWGLKPAGFAGVSDAILSLAVAKTGGCPVCGGRSGRAIARFRNRTYFRCARTGLVYLKAFDRDREAYGESYFFDDYKHQYGRTYLEDFEHIQELSQPRLEVIRKLLPQGGSLLDVGCAYGPFLAAAAEKGFLCYGTDISAPAVEYVKSRLGMKAAAADFTNFDPALHFGIERFDCLTMWYVIEHFEDLRGALETAAKIVRPGGVFAFSTPNICGISAKRSLKWFLDSSPPDHFTVWSPRTARTVLEAFGFDCRVIRVTGHHPERFPLMRSVRGGIAHWLLTAASRACRLGDTFEIYAERRREDDDE